MDQQLDQPGGTGPSEQHRAWRLPPPARLRGRLVSPPKTRPLVHIVLFLATFATTTMAGAAHAGANPFESVGAFLSGLPFSATLMLILLSHELGHYALALYHHVPTT